MRRKVIQIADSTQLISLPRKWAQHYGIKKGDELEIEEQGSNILVKKSGEPDKPMSIEVDVTNLDKDTLIFLYRGLYVRGYDEIKFIFNKPLMPHYKSGEKVKVISVIHGELSRSTGLEIMQERENFCVLKRISSYSIKEFDSVLKRAFLLLIDAAEDLYEGLKNRDFNLIATLEEKHSTITKLILYDLRILNTIGYREYENSFLLFHIVASLDLIIDILKNAARDMIEIKIKPTKECIEIVNMIKEAFKIYYDLYYNFTLEKAQKFSYERDKTLHMIKKHSKNLSKDDVRITVALQQCMEIFRNIYSTRIGMEY